MSQPANEQEVEVHPFVDALAHQLVPTTRDPINKLVFTDVGLNKAEELLRSVFDKPADFMLAVQSLNLFVEYLRTERDSPNAADSLNTVLRTLADEQAQHNLSREEEQRAKVSSEFGKFTGTKARSEDDVAKDKPLIPAKDLLRGHIKR